ncbi:unnamed protein product [Trifolium pratense]|uniref:Uncharacterized protein n=1 Tax=Trifolium pratense TaxID=57577 RepID=A0ACB0JC51_TRIPR|nr:unnamed protein product [Trifolium pratense]
MKNSSTILNPQPTNSNDSFTDSLASPLAATAALAAGATAPIERTLLSFLKVKRGYEEFVRLTIFLSGDVLMLIMLERRSKL